MNDSTWLHEVLTYVQAHPWWTLVYLRMFRLVSVYVTKAAKHE